MKLDRQKYDLAKARACKGQKELMAEGIPKGPCAERQADIR